MCKGDKVACGQNGRMSKCGIWTRVIIWHVIKSNQNGLWLVTKGTFEQEYGI